jgi:hypothetical protein
MLRRFGTLPSRCALLSFLLLLICAHSATAQVPNFPACQTTGAQSLPKNSICEVVLPQSFYTLEFDAYTKPDVKAVFTNSTTGTSLTVHGFYDIPAGSSQIVFKIRFNASEQGNWSYTTNCTLQATGASCNVPALVTGPKTFTVSASAERGFLRRDAGHPNKFVYDDGYHPFIWGQTYYQLINNAISNGGWQSAITNSKNSRLNKFRMLLYPWWAYYASYGDTQPFAGSTTIPNHDKLNIPHWRKFDEVINTLYSTFDNSGSRLLAELILFKDPALDSNGNVLDNHRTFGQNTTQDDRYIKYAIARFGAFPNVMWCLSNEWQFAVNDKNYWNARATTIVGNGTAASSYDPWMYAQTPAGQQQRALSIHPKNLTLFQFFDQMWPAHAVLQFSIGHPSCGAGNPCLNSDEWANFSILNNLSGGKPVSNDEYGYLNSKRDANCNSTFTSPEQRRAMWAIAIGGGYGTFGDATGQCPSPGTVPPIIKSDWVLQSAYTEIKAMSDFFTLNFTNTWWLMAPNNARVSPDASNSMRAYALERAGQYVIYAVPTGNAVQGAFNVNNLPIGNYTATYYNPRNGTWDAMTSSFTILTSPSSKLLSTPTYDDWVIRILPNGGDTVWVEDGLPAGAIASTVNDAWNWISSNPTPFSGSLAHQSNVFPDLHQHYFDSATNTLNVNVGDMMVAYVYLDPANPPSELMLQWNDGTWEHRAYWGQNLIGWGVDGTNSRRYMGTLPTTGQWVRLEVAASALGLEGRPVNGMAFTLFGGRAAWDHMGKRP